MEEALPLKTNFVSYNMKEQEEHAPPNSRFGGYHFESVTEIAAY
jgi:hypothetical protein